MENWRCKNLVFPRQTRNMAPIVGGTFKTLLHTHTHTYSSSFKLPILTLDSSHKWVQTSWVFSCSWALHMIDWKCCFLTCKLWHPYAPQTHGTKRFVFTRKWVLSWIHEGGEGGRGPKRWWCLVCPFQQCRLLALLTYDSVRYVNDVTIPTTNNWQFPSKIF
jgi:hypothetical protein